MESNSTRETQFRQAFKHLNRFMLLMWRLGLGYWFRWPRAFGRIMVLCHHGRKTGLLRRTPVNYALLGDDLYCTVGFGSGSDWYKNIVKDPRIEVWMPDGWWAGSAEDVSDHEDRAEILRQVLIGGGFATRIAGIDPYHIPQEELEALLATYRLIHIRRTEARTGAGGPGDLAWIWQVVATLMLPLLFIRRKSTSTKRKG
jgi:deazaflavin-dependent oxidoreductase (nitroreductase family)